MKENYFLLALYLVTLFVLPGQGIKHFRRRDAIKKLDQSLKDVTQKSQKTSQECKCINPFALALQEFAGEPSYVCREINACFVLCDSDCPDTTKLTGFLNGLCQSKSACLNEGGNIFK